MVAMTAVNATELNSKCVTSACALWSEDSCWVIAQVLKSMVVLRMVLAGRRKSFLKLFPLQESAAAGRPQTQIIFNLT